MLIKYNIACNMNEKDKAKLEIKIANEEYRDPDFGFSWKEFSWKEFLLGFLIGWFIMLLIFR